MCVISCAASACGPSTVPPVGEENAVPAADASVSSGDADEACSTIDVPPALGWGESAPWTVQERDACLLDCPELADDCATEQACPGVGEFAACMVSERASCASAEDGSCRVAWLQRDCCVVGACPDSLGDEAYFECIATACSREDDDFFSCFLADRTCFDQAERTCLGVAE